MASCGLCPRGAALPPPTPQLFDIRRGSRARWNDLALSVESDSGEWRLLVEDTPGRRVLYTGWRGNASAARIAAAEFAIFYSLGAQSAISPQRLAADLAWQTF